MYSKDAWVFTPGTFRWDLSKDNKELSNEFKFEETVEAEDKDK